MFLIHIGHLGVPWDTFTTFNSAWKYNASYIFNLKISRDFPGGAVVKNLPANAGDTGSSPGPGRSHMPWSN